MNKAQMRRLAREYGILNMRIRQIEERKKEIKEALEDAMGELPTQTSARGSLHHVLTNVPGFVVKMYSRTQFYADQKKARKLLHPNTWAAIFKPSTFNVVDVRPTAEVKKMGVDAFLAQLDFDEAS